MNISKLISLLEETAELLELAGANSFKVSAFSKGARVLSDLGGELDDYLNENRLTEIPGIGKGLADKIREFEKTGKIAELEELREKIPAGLREMTNIPGLGPKRATLLFEELNIASVPELKKACEENRLSELKGFGKKSQEKILLGIEQMTKFAGRFRLDVARKAADGVLQVMRPVPQVQQIEVAGSLRRWKETVHDLDFVVATEDAKAAMDAFCGMEGVRNILGHGDTKSSVILENGMQADIRCMAPADYPYALLHFSGSKEFNTKLRGRAKDYGLKLNEYGLFPENSAKSLPAESEEDIFKHLELRFIPPEMREDMGEVELAAEKPLPCLLEMGDLRGLLHLHTHYSDGKPQVEEYAVWALENGIEWMGISDHSQSLKVANGLSEERILKQHEEIDAVNAKFSKMKIRILKGIESDILPDGSLDYSDEFLKNFEFIVASVHTHFNLTEKEQTARVLRAIDNPATTVLGHLTGRLLLAREGFSIDQKEILRAAGKAGVGVEINANPHRLDLDWRLLRYAVEQGCKIAISPDAHVMAGLGDTIYGVAMGRKGWLEKENTLNCLSADDFLKFARSRH